MGTNIRHLINFEKVDTLLEDFNKLTGFVTAIIDLEGNVLSKSGWRQMCTEFHRVNPETSKKCTISDTELANKMGEGEKYHFYKCLNGLVDVAVPIVINGEHVANLFSGQFFLEVPDATFFKKQAEKYGFDEGKYLSALKNIPVVSEEKVKTVMNFMLNMTQMISEITSQKIEQAELNKTIRESEEKQKSILNNMTDAVWSISWPDLAHNFISPPLEKLYGRPKQELLDNPNLFQDITHPDDQHLTEKAMQQLREKGEAERECRIIKPDGKIVWVNDKSKMIYDENQQPIRVDGVTRDITERKQAEEEHRKFFTITEKALFGSVIADPGGNLVYVNDYFAQIHGYTVKELIGAKLDIFHSHSQMPLVRKTIVDALEKGNIEAVEIPHLHKNGHEFPMLMSLAIINGSHGKSKYIAATAFDLTEQKAIQQKLQNTVNDQNLMLDNDPTLIYFKDRNNKIIRVTESVAKATGLSREEIEGRPTKEIYPDMADQYWKDDLEVIKSGKPKHNIVEPLTGVGGSSHWLLTTKVPVKNDSGEIVGICVFATDITHLKNTELELIKAKEKTEKSEERFRLAMKASNDGLFDWNLETNEIYYSPGWKKMLGYEDHELPNDFSVWEKTTDSEDVKKSWELQQKLIKKQIDRFVMEFKMKHKDGHWVDVLAKAEAIFNEQGKAIRMIGTHTDITERKQAELELIIAKLRAEESDHLKSAFLANMSHEIRTPMNGILGFADLLKEPGLNGEQQQKYIEIIEKSGKRMLNIINDIVDISKIEAGLMKLHLTKSNINEQIEYVYTFFKPEVEAKGISFSFKNALPAQAATITTDREKMFAILTNLVKNAIKYTPGGAIEFGYDLDEEQGLAPRQLTFFIKDTGIGIPHERQAAIFERFVQADIEDRDARQGAGLGLTITKSYVEMLEEKYG